MQTDDVDGVDGGPCRRGRALPTRSNTHNSTSFTRAWGALDGHNARAARLRGPHARGNRAATPLCGKEGGGWGVGRWLTRRYVSVMAPNSASLSVGLVPSNNPNGRQRIVYYVSRRQIISMCVRGPQPCPGRAPQARPQPCPGRPPQARFPKMHVLVGPIVCGSEPLLLGAY